MAKLKCKTFFIENDLGLFYIVVLYNERVNILNTKMSYEIICSSLNITTHVKLLTLNNFQLTCS